MNFYYTCTNELKLNIVGLMCLPPKDSNVNTYFERMALLKKSTGVKELSMGMSADYVKAVEFGASYLRIGSGIFGNRG